MVQKKLIRKLWSRTTAIVVATVFVAVGVVAAGILYQKDIVSELNRLSLLPRPDSLTELYFSDQQAVPVAYTPGQPLALSFVVHNMENQSTTYSYMVTEQSPDATTNILLATGQVTLQPDQYQVIRPHIVMTDVGKQAGVFVGLSPVHESIHVWVRRPS